MARKTARTILVILFSALAVCAIASTEDLQRAVQIDGNNVISRYNLGVAYSKDKQYGQAVEELKKAMEVNREDREKHAKVDFLAAQQIGIIYFNFLDNDGEALNYFQKAGQLNPADGDNYYYMAMAYKKGGKPEESLKMLLKALDMGASDTAEINYMIGQVYYEKKEFGSALEYFEKVVAKKPDHAGAREYLGDIYDRRENADKAVENYTRVVRIDPNNLHAQYQLGLNYFKQKEYDKMIAAYKKAIAINPGFDAAHYNLGMAYFYRNMYEDAIKEFQTTISLNPNDAAAYSLLAQTKTTAYEYHMSRGSTFLTEEDYLQAREELMKALDVKPGDSDAEKYLSKANEEINRQVPAKIEAAKKSFAAGNYSEAYNSWDFVLKADPGNSEAKDGMAKMEDNMNALISAREQKARGYETTGNLAEAIAEYAAIKEIATKSKKAAISEKISSLMVRLNSKVGALLESANAAYAKKQYKTAVAKYSEVLRYEAGNSKALNGITKANSAIEADKEKYLALAKQNKSSNEAKSVELYKKVLEMDPNNESANKAIEDITGSQSKVSINAQKVKSLYYEGVDKYVNGEVETAIKIWKKVLIMDSSHVEARKNIIRAEEKLKAIKSLSR